MVNWLLRKVFGTYHERERKRLWPVVERISALEPTIQTLSGDALRAKTSEFKARIQQALAGTTFLDPSNPQWYDLTPDERTVARRQQRDTQQRLLDAVLPEAFAVVREAARRTVRMRHFDVQLLGGIVLHEGEIAEMATGEGKTLVATLAAYLNALTGRGVHIVTVNDYLARRDARWMGPIYHLLGLSVGVIQGVDPAERRAGEESLSFLYEPTFVASNERFMSLRPVTRPEAYRADITYGQNNEFGFDYLRDNMRFQLEDLSQREFHYAIVDEVDSILIDEARTPLIISGPAEESTDLYYRLDKLVAKVEQGRAFEVDEKAHSVSLTEEGIKRCEELLGVENLYDERNMRLVHHINQALRAHHLFRRDVDYVVKDGEIMIVDEFTGRLMPGRRWSDGLHQAIEAKEDVRIRQENQTLASVTFQNYFRMYEKLAGMTGTAATEAQEFAQIYHLDVVIVPTNRPLIRTNVPDVVYKTEDEKFVAIVQEIVELHRAGRPVLVGTISIDTSERLSRLLKEPAQFVKRVGLIAQWAREELKTASLTATLHQRLEACLSRPAMASEQEVSDLLAELKTQVPTSMLVFRVEELWRLIQTITAIKAGIPHNVLNAKYHEQEAQIVAQAGHKGAVTIATNMAGRGTDIVLGGNPQALTDQRVRAEEAKRQAPLEEDEQRAMFERYAQACAAEHHEVVGVGGLHVLGTERHEARRIDNQLRGRSGRQGDPGSSRFYLSFEDDLMRIFGSDRIARIMEFKWFKWEEGLPIEHRMITRSIETAQHRVEGQNFDIRKQLLEYDNTMNRQREVIYEQRRRILEGIDLKGLVYDIIDEVVGGLLDTFASGELRPDAWDLEGLRTVIQHQFGIPLTKETVSGGREEVAERLVDVFRRAYDAKRQELTPEIMAQLERSVLLRIMDVKWKDQLYMMDALREGIGLRAYGQRDPVVEYQREAYGMFQNMIGSIKSESLTMLLRVQPIAEARQVSVFAKTPQQEVHPELSSRLAERFTRPQRADAAADRAALPDQASVEPAGPSTALQASGPGRRVGVPAQRLGRKVGRNEPCPCGSGLKYKKCHGK